MHNSSESAAENVKNEVTAKCGAWRCSDIILSSTMYTKIMTLDVSTLKVMTYKTKQIQSRPTREGRKEWGREWRLKKGQEKDRGNEWGKERLKEEGRKRNDGGN